MKNILTAILAIAATIAQAQQISYGEYMEKVLTNNIALTAQRLNIEIATANVKASKIHNNPTLGITYSSNENWDKKLGYAIEGELSRTFTFGVRSGRIAVAKQEQRETTALFEEYMRNFRADATIAYLEHLKAIAKQQIAADNEKDLAGVAHNDSVRYAKGDIAKADWLDSRMAAGLARNNRLAADAAVRSTAIRLGYYMGNLDNAEEIRGAGTLETEEPLYPVDTYIERATANRADLQAALCRVDIAEAARKFNAAQRRTDIDIKVGATYNRGARAEEPFDPSFTTVKAGIAVPLKLSNLNKGARTADRLRVQQALQEAENATLVVQSEVKEAYNEYLYAIMQTQTFTQQMVKEMSEIVANKRKAYEMGEISFLDYISIERRQNEMSDSYIESLFNKAVSWVELQRATGCGMEFSTKPINE